MTGKIEDLLFSSEAARSLLMERRVADSIRERRWRAKTGIYYTDPTTQKLREMDVYGVQVFDRPRKSKGTGAPLINLYLICECKSLAGSNVLFVPDKAPDPIEFRGMSFWLGHEARTIVLDIAEQAGITDHNRIKRLYDYVTDRAYSD